MPLHDDSVRDPECCQIATQSQTLTKRWGYFENAGRKGVGSLWRNSSCQMDRFFPPKTPDPVTLFTQEKWRNAAFGFCSAWGIGTQRNEPAHANLLRAN